MPAELRFPRSDSGSSTPEASVAVPPVAIAQWCAGQGWPVHPLAPGRKTPAANCNACRQPGHTHHGCNCRTSGRWCHGFHAATLDPARIQQWWSQTPDPGVGVACGPAGLVVIDIDAHAQIPLPGTASCQASPSQTRSTSLGWPTATTRWAFWPRYVAPPARQRTKRPFGCGPPPVGSTSGTAQATPAPGSVPPDPEEAGHWPGRWMCAPMAATSSPRAPRPAPEPIRPSETSVSLLPCPPGSPRSWNAPVICQPPDPRSAAGAREGTASSHRRRRRS